MTDSTSRVVLSPDGLIFASYVRDGEVRTGSLAQNPPHPTEVARKKLEREGQEEGGRHVT